MPKIIKKTVEVYADLFKSVPFVPDQGINMVVSSRLAQQRPLPKGFGTHANNFATMGRWRNWLKKVGSISFTDN